VHMVGPVLRSTIGLGFHGEFISRLTYVNISKLKLIVLNLGFKTKRCTFESLGVGGG
jgi:hypothetical protein